MRTQMVGHARTAPGGSAPRAYGRPPRSARSARGGAQPVPRATGTGTAVPDHESRSPHTQRAGPGEGDGARKWQVAPEGRKRARTRCPRKRRSPPAKTGPTRFVETADTGVERVKAGAGWPANFTAIRADPVQGGGQAGRRCIGQGAAEHGMTGPGHREEKYEAVVWPAQAARARGSRVGKFQGWQL